VVGDLGCEVGFLDGEEAAIGLMVVFEGNGWAKGSGGSG